MNQLTAPVVVIHTASTHNVQRPAAASAVLRMELAREVFIVPIVVFFPLTCDDLIISPESKRFICEV